MRTTWRKGLVTLGPGRLAGIGAAALAVAAVVGGGTAVALAGGDPSGSSQPEHAAHPDGTDPSAAHEHDDAGSGGVGRGDDAGHHEHPDLAPYDQRYREASDGERQAADDLVAATSTAVAPYGDPAAAEAAGYGPPRRAGGRLHHYLNKALVDDGRVLDPAHPEGLVFADGPDGPQLVGAFFVAPPEVAVPAGGGDLVTWHSHDPACDGFWATVDQPCTGSRRMLHVWTASTADLVRRSGEAVTVKVVDPFGAPFFASVERAR